MRGSKITATDISRKHLYDSSSGDLPRIKDKAKSRSPRPHMTIKHHECTHQAPHFATPKKSPTKSSHHVSALNTSEKKKQQFTDFNHYAEHNSKDPTLKNDNLFAPMIARRPTVESPHLSDKLAGKIAHTIDISPALTKLVVKQDMTLAHRTFHNH